MASDTATGMASFGTARVRPEGMTTKALVLVMS